MHNCKGSIYIYVCVCVCVCVYSVQSYFQLSAHEVGTVHFYDSTAHVSTTLSCLQGYFVTQENSNFVETYKYQLYVYKQTMCNV
jgi:hypothetical protein